MKFIRLIRSFYLATAFIGILLCMVMLFDFFLGIVFIISLVLLPVISISTVCWFVLKKITNTVQYHDQISHGRDEVLGEMTGALSEAIPAGNLSYAQKGGVRCKS